MAGGTLAITLWVSGTRIAFCYSARVTTDIQLHRVWRDLLGRDEP